MRIDGRLFVTDRSYRLGAYSLDGEYLGEISENVSAIGLSEDGRSFYHLQIIGGQWGDEGKGKLVDLLAAEHDPLLCHRRTPESEPPGSGSSPQW